MHRSNFLKFIFVGLCAFAATVNADWQTVSTLAKLPPSIDIHGCSFRVQAFDPASPRLNRTYLTLSIASQSLQPGSPPITILGAPLSMSELVMIGNYGKIAANDIYSHYQTGKVVDAGLFITISALEKSAKFGLGEINKSGSIEYVPLKFEPANFILQKECLKPAASALKPKK